MRSMSGSSRRNLAVIRFSISISLALFHARATRGFLHRGPPVGFRQLNKVSLPCQRGTSRPCRAFTTAFSDRPSPAIPSRGPPSVKKTTGLRRNFSSAEAPPARTRGEEDASELKLGSACREYFARRSCRGNTLLFAPSHFSKTQSSTIATPQWHMRDHFFTPRLVECPVYPRARGSRPHIAAPEGIGLDPEHGSGEWPTP